MHIFCDFDGTISCDDTTDVVLTALAAPEWEMIEAEWKAGQIGSAECMQRQIALIKPDTHALDALLDTIDIDPGFTDFLRFAKDASLPVSILSDGVDYFIHRILSRHQVAYLPIRANHLATTNDGRFVLTSPYQDKDCAAKSGVCKCNALNTGKEPRIFIGDGRSDFCASGNADIVFAKGTLATFCEQQGIAYHAYSNFHDVTRMLKSLLPSLKHEQYGLFARTASQF